ncbi:hypothetical protein BGW80DRAFT_240383 [Lactifluus volemus]|nr:hypothetical protein BGW80DRAFT_240383 [Lactifluus volemus]
MIYNVDYWPRPMGTHANGIYHCYTTRMIVHDCECKSRFSYRASAIIQEFQCCQWDPLAHERKHKKKVKATDEPSSDVVVQT